jgi:haloacetate dehalogenase
MHTHQTPVLNLFPGAQQWSLQRDGVGLNVITLGDAKLPPLLMLHGHPQSSALWHLVAPELAKRHRLVMTDLRGYGDSERPAPGLDFSGYSKREMALDALNVMRQLGHEQFDVIAHDRGARVAHRLASDHPAAVKKMMLLDIAPTLAMYAQTSEGFARTYWHWFFLIQANGLPEALIDADPVRYLRACMGSRRADGLSVFAPAALAEYERCIAIEGSSRGICGDYKASASIDLEHDRADVVAGKQLTMPLHVLWGEWGAVGKYFDPLALWRERADHVSGQALPCAHYIAEEQPQALIEAAKLFFNGAKHE